MSGANKAQKRLEETRAKYHALWQEIGPSLGLSEGEKERLGFVDIAKRIEAEDTRDRYCDAVIKMLQANIDCDKPYAQQIEPASNYINWTGVVVSTVAVGAITLWLSHLAIALLIAALWLALANRTRLARMKARAEEIEEHNANTLIYVKSIQEWKKTISELLDLQATLV